MFGCLSLLSLLSRCHCTRSACGGCVASAWLWLLLHLVSLSILWWLSTSFLRFHSGIASTRGMPNYSNLCFSEHFSSLPHA
ncbi:hypothetical protein V6Z12_D03G137900 [Gossypium hirsutum]